MRVLVVGPYPPMRDGIAVYTREHVGRLRGGGDRVTVLSPPEGHGDVRRRLRGGAAFRWVWRRGGRFDRVVVEFQPSLYFRPRRALSKVATSSSFLAMTWTHRRRVEIVVHEADHPALWRPDHLLLREAFRSAGQVTFHTETEWRSLERHYGLRVRGRVVPHTVAPAGPTPPTKEDARRALGLRHVSAPLFVCPGFLHPDKGYDRAVRALSWIRTRTPAGRSRIPPEGPPARLYIVGSVREPTARNVVWARELRALCDATPGATLVERFVDDEEFDRWVAAADRVILPYRRSWSSGVLARAHALGTPALVAHVGGLGEQAGGEDVVFADDEALRRAMQRVVDGAAAGSDDG